MTDDLVKCLNKGVASTEQQQDAADRIEELEAKLAKAVEALTKAAEYHEDERTWWDIDRSKDIRATLAELTGPDSAAPDKPDKGGHDD